MKLFWQIRLFLQISRSHSIVRRYFVVNGFDGALTMLGLITGFYFSNGVTLSVIIAACMAAAIALGMSGLTSAYISEAAERQKELQELESAMLDNLDESTHAKAARIIPFMIAAVNGLAPLLISLCIISPIWLAELGIGFVAIPLESAVITALLIIFLLGVFLGRVSGGFWLWAGIRTLIIGLITTLLIYLLSPV
jgi:predicted membrane protein (TIGR00267 family)